MCIIGTKKDLRYKIRSFSQFEENYKHTDQRSPKFSNKITTKLQWYTL